MSSEANQANNPDSSQEPSIEEILASIRKIISDDEPQGAAVPNLDNAPDSNTGMTPMHNAMPAPPAQTPMMPITDDDDILELTDYLEEEPQSPLADASMPTAKPTVFAEETRIPEFVPAPQINVQPQPASEHVPPAPVDRPVFAAPPLPATAPADDSLLSNQSARAATDALSRLAKSSQNLGGRDHNSMLVSNRTLDSITEDLLRPLLREWLDANLPRLVEKLVERELHRMARRAEEE